MSSRALSLKVLAAYARDIGRGLVRMDHQSMDALGVTAGDTIEIIGKKLGMDAKCYPLLPSDEGQGITRIDPELREIIGVTIDDSITIRKVGPVAVEKYTQSKEKHGDAEPSPPPSQPTPAEGMGSERAGATATASPIFVLAGSCIGFEKERPKLMDFITTLEAAAHDKSKCKCYSDGKKALGWDFFLLEMDEKFVDKLRDVYPDIEKQEAGTLEERLALWMNKQLKKRKMDFHIKLSDVPQETVKGFRLDPEFYRDKTDLDDLR